jgi:hypothetical protein
MNGSVYKRRPCTKTSSDKQKKACKKNHGSWYFIHDVPTFGGERRPRIKRGGFPTKDAAENALAESLARSAQRGVTAERDMSGRRQHLGDYLTEWLAGKPDIKPSTRHTYADHINRFLIPRLGHLRLEDLTVSHIAAMLAELREPKAKPRKPKRPKKPLPAPTGTKTCQDGRQARSRGELRA